MDDTFVFNGLVDVNAFVKTHIRGVVLEVSPFMEKVECNSPLVQVGLVEV